MPRIRCSAAEFDAKPDAVRSSARPHLHRGPCPYPQAAEHVQAVHGGEQVKERVRHVAIDVDAGRVELDPGDQLANHNGGTDNITVVILVVESA